MVVNVLKVKVRISSAKISCEGADNVHQTYMKVGTIQPLKGTENESNINDSYESLKRHMNDWPPKIDRCSSYMCSCLSDMIMVLCTCW
jgi:hypothetical protein